MKAIKKELGIKAYCFIISFVFLMFASANSFLYRHNFYGDPNAFMMIGKRMLRGDIMYKDFYEHKGPYMCLLSEVMCFISSNSFVGMFVVEVLTFFIFLYFAYKVCSLYMESRQKLLIPILACIFLIGTLYRQEITVEQVCIVFMEISLYMLIKYYRNEMKEYIWLVQGIFTGIIFWFKYTILIIYIAWCLVILYNCVKNKELYKLVKIVVLWSFGIIIATIPMIVYFTKNDAWVDLYKAYYYNVVHIYSKELGRIWYLSLVWLIKLFFTNVIFFVVLIIGCVFFLSKENKCSFVEKELFFYPILMFMVYNGVNTKNWSYTWQPLYVFMPIALLAIINKNNLLKGLIVRKLERRKKIYIEICVSIVSLIFLIIFSEQVKKINYKDNDYTSVVFAEEISKHENSGVIVYKSIDPGVYMELNRINEMKYFNYYNIWTHEIDEEYKKAFLVDKVEYVITHSSMSKEDREFLKKMDYYVCKTSKQKGQSAYFELWKRK